MARRSLVFRFVIYSLLALAACTFIAPFAWMVSTSLKPAEQSTSNPPTWIPVAYTCQIGDQRMEVTLDYKAPQPGAVAILTAGEHRGERVFLSDSQLAHTTDVKIEHRFQAGWWHVTQKIERKSGHDQPLWDFVPDTAITKRIAFRWRNYPDALSRLDGGTDDRTGLQSTHRVSFWRFLGNSMTICVLGVIGTVISNSIIAYGFARVRWRGRDAFFAITLATLMVPFPVLMVPLYSVYKHLGWIGTLLPLWVPAWFGSAFNIFLMRQFFLGIPEELSEAARIDGCSEWRIFWRIILPLSKPVLATAALFHFLYAWNDFMGPLLYLTRKETFPLSLALQSFESQIGGVEWHYLMAASTVTMLPVIVLFFFAQKTFIRGIATTGSKS